MKKLQQDGIEPMTSTMRQLTYHTEPFYRNFSQELFSSSRNFRKTTKNNFLPISERNQNYTRIVIHHIYKIFCTFLATSLNVGNKSIRSSISYHEYVLLHFLIIQVVLNTFDTCCARIILCGTSGNNSASCEAITTFGSGGTSGKAEGGISLGSQFESRNVPLFVSIYFSSIFC